MRSMLLSSVSLALLVFATWPFGSGLPGGVLMNQPPVVAITAGGGAVLPATATTLAMAATASDDGLPLGSSLSYHWCKESGPGPVVFDDPHALQTAAHFDIAGVYKIRFSADDGDQEGHKTVTVTVNQPTNLPVAVQDILASASNPALDPLFADRFLTLIPNAIPYNTTGAAYYAQVDPQNQKTNFASWLAANNFGSGGQPLYTVITDAQAECCSAGVYLNAGDLGFGRRMVMSRSGDEIAFWVTNYMTVDGAIAEDPSELILTVCMEYTSTPGINGGLPYIKYFMFDANGTRVTDIDFDGRGFKPVPQACAACHGGSYSNGGGIPAGGNMNAVFLPFDVANYDFSCQDGFELEDQELAFKQMNEAILSTNPPLAIRELIEGWYGGFGLPDDNQNTRFVPPGWASDPELYRAVVAKSCRMCHMGRSSPTLDFNAAADFTAQQGKISGPLLFGPSPSGFRMPHAERTFERFWLSTSPQQPMLLASAFQNGVYVGLGDPATRLYVDAAAAGANDGSSWADALTSLSAALAQAGLPNSGITEIFVAAGTYRPDGSGLADPRTATFAIPSGVSLYGGFSSGQLLIEDRDLLANETILSGDLAGDDGSGGSNVENAHHVVTMNQCAASTRLDGVTILAGNASGAADPRGAGILVSGGSPLLSRLQIEGNVAPQGGGILASATGARLVNVGLYGNDGMVAGGGILSVGGSVLRLDNCVLSYNLAESMGGTGGGLYAIGGQVDVVNSTFYRNYADQMGAGLELASAAQVTVGNTIFWHNCTNNVVDEDAQIFLDAALGSPSLQLDYCLVDGLTGALGGTANSAADPLFINPNGNDGLVGTRDDDMRLQEGSPAVDAGNNDLVRADVADIDYDGLIGERLGRDFQGLKRFFDANATADTGNGSAPVVDIGAIERNDGSLLACGAGNIRVGVDGPHDVVMVNGSSGGSSRLVYVATGQSLTIAIDQPPAQPFAPFALFLSFGIPGPDDVFALPFGLGDMCFIPAPLKAFNDGDFVLADSLGLGYPTATGATLAPWSVTVPMLDPTEGDFVIQGLVWDDTKAIPLSVTNAVLVSVRTDPPVNFPPIAVVADANVGAFTNGAVTLDGSGSYDPEGEALGYSWTQTGGTAVVLNNANAAVASFTAPAAADVLTFELVVNDGAQDSIAGQVVVTVVSDTPIANAGNNQTVITNAAVALDGSLSADPQGTPVTYAWTQIGGTAVALAGANTVSPSFTAPALHDVLTFQLIVSDGTNFSSPDTVTVTVLTSFANDVVPVFSTSYNGPPFGAAVRCIDCHSNGGAFSGGSPAGGLNLSTSELSVGLVRLGVLLRVNNGTPTQSAILRYPLYTAAGGISMGGLTNGGLLPDTNDSGYVRILNWILDGTPNN
ncbi:MAG: hypothetical protein H6807_01540 [Planctomycetes bacterium]|nr:hypothetical protein [Planctomycetota bacterium]